MKQSEEQLFQVLMTQLGWQPDDQNMQSGRVADVTIHTHSRRYTFQLRFERRLSAAQAKRLIHGIQKKFLGIAATEVELTYEDERFPTEEEWEAYWPLVVEREALNDGVAKQLLCQQLPTIDLEQRAITLRAENQQVQATIENRYAQSIVSGYRKLGFPDFRLNVIVDTETVNDRMENFNSRKEALEKEQQEIAKKAIERQEKQAKEPETIIPDKIKIGRDIPNDTPLQPMSSFKEEERGVIMEGVVFEVEVKELKTGRCILNAKISDYTSAFSISKFSKNDEEVAIFKAIKTGMWLRVRGDIRMDDRFLRDLVLNVYDLEEISKDVRQDTAEEKRVELHLHTKMSALDATNTITDYVEQAKKWGMSAIALTDHGGVQAFPEASRAAKANGIKVLYGMEANVVDDGIPIAYQPQHINLEDATYVVFDVETTGLSAIYDKIIELSAVKMEKGNVIDEFSEFINPGHPLSKFTTDLTSITDDMVADARPEEDIINDFRNWAEGTILVAHNATFDMGFLNTAYRRYGLPEADNAVIDTLEFARFLHPEFKSYRLNTLAKHYKVNLEQHHRAIYDAESTGALAWIFVNEAKEDHGYRYHDELNNDLGQNDAYKNGRPFHVTLLAKDQEGLKDMFKLVSASNVKYFYRVPRIPRSVLNKYRKHLLVGSACAEGEVWEAAMQKGKSQASDKAKKYDFLEIQPKEVYQPLLDKNLVHNEQELEKIIKNILEIGKDLDIPVVATGDVHYLNPEDKIYREILKNSDKSHPPMKSFPEAHFRTTNEMLEAFSFLGEETAHRIVIENSQKIADMIDEIEPIHNKLYTPHINGAEEAIRDDSYQRAHDIYGDELPEIVSERLERELKSIIGNGFSVIYYIAQKLVAKSNDDGYIVGSRGSVGSSFVATMLGITEVNPLSPHYVCLNCHHSEFFTHGEIGSGFDLPDKKCPECGELMMKDGHEIPFETFLGFHGDKVPDIDLNFSGEYQADAHEYTKVLFGEDHVFKAGTISTVAEKTAYGYVLGYDRDNNLNLRPAERDFYAKGATGAKRTTGQHPGGIIVIPDDMDVFDFTPVQYPADEQNASWRTTHFDFHSIHDNVLKLDCLGHDDPTVIRKLQDLSGIAPTAIPTDDAEVYKIFNGTDALGVTPEQIFSKTGTFGIPEFGTRFVRQMLEDTHPSTFAELVQISGLSHGTDVWLGNSQVLVREKGLELKEVIGCRDDIMMDLIHMGVPTSDSFQIMEKVRKGKGLSEEHRAIMKEHNVPEWFMWSCTKIKYMFPKAHAAAYVLNALRVAWFKVHKPLYYYCAYLSVRAYDFDLPNMSGGLETCKGRLKEIMAKGNDATKKEQDLQIVLELVNEMWERGYRFEMVDLEKSDAESFIIDEENKALIAPFRAIPGLGTSVAHQIIAAREESPFLSKEDLKKRAHVSQSTIDFMTQYHMVDNLPDENQLSLFDM